MEQRLVERARDGDPAAFTSLVQRYQEMALGYALSILRDFHLAQDVTQEALLAAYRSLHTLEDPARFPAWLRGIVRFQCGRVLRQRCLDLVPLERAYELASTMIGPEGYLEVKEVFHRALEAIRDLPESQREVAMLFYIKDYTQREVAGFLELPVTTVNNRLHAARKALRRRVQMESEKIGRVIAVRGPVVDVRFEPEYTPLILAALRAGGRAEGNGPLLQVVQRVGGGLVRCLAREGSAGLAPDTGVVDTGGPLLATLDAEMVAAVVPIVGTTSRNGASAPERAAEARPELLETGIKVIDLLCPYTRGGTVGFFGPSGTGRMVVSAEVLRNTARREDGVAIFAFVHGESEARGWYDEPAEVPHPAGAGGLICLPIANPIDAASPEVLAASPLLDARTYLSFNLGASGLWPAVDPLLSTSRLMDPAIVGQEHYDVARAARLLLHRCRELQEGPIEGMPRQLSTEDRTVVTRARKLQRFFTQPFAVAEAFTGRPGQTVPLAETIRVCAALLAGAYDHVPEEAFMWRGTIE